MTDYFITEPQKNLHIYTSAQTDLQGHTPVTFYHAPVQ